MNCFEPLITHSPPSRRAVVRRRAGIRSRLRLGQPEAGESRAREQVGQQLLLLRVGAEAEDRHRAEAHARLEGDRERLVDPAERLDREAQREVVAALAAELLGERQAEQAELAHLRDDIERQGLGAVGLVGTRRDDLVGEFADEVGELAARRRSGRSSWCLPSLVGRSLRRVRGSTRARIWSRRTWSPIATSIVASAVVRGDDGMLHLHRLDRHDALPGRARARRRRRAPRRPRPASARAARGAAAAAGPAASARRPRAPPDG